MSNITLININITIYIS